MTDSQDPNQPHTSEPAYQTPYQALGEEGIRELTNAFYDMMDALPQASDLRAMHAKDLTPMKEKLAEYLTGWMGGPPRYADKYGTVCMTTPHEHYAIGPKLRDQWLLCMEHALDEIAAEPALREMLKTPLYRIADAVRNRSHDSTMTEDPNIIAAS